MSNSELETKVTPVGDIAFLAVRNSVRATEQIGTQTIVKKDSEGNDIRHYVCSLVIDGNTKEGAALRESVLAVNSKLTSSAGLPDGFYKIQAKTRFDGVVVGTLDGDVLSQNDIPYFNSKTDSGKASMKIALDPTHGTIYLKAVALDMNSLKLEPREEITDEERELRMKQARQSIVEEMAKLANG